MERLAPMNHRGPDNAAHVSFHQVTLDLKVEFKRAIAKHGFKRTPAHAGMEDGERLKILVEEIGEVARAMTYDEGSTDKLIAELIQLGAMAAASVVGIRAHLDTQIEEAFKHDG